MTSPFVNTSPDTQLDTQVFQDKLDFKTLEDILEILVKVKAKKVSRQEFNDLKGDFLVENGKDKKGEQKYILNLPEDLKQFELAYIIDYLTTKFNIQDYANIEEIINKTKIAVSVVLRQEGGEEYLKNLVEEYNIPENFVNKIKTTKLNITKTKEFIKEIKSKRNINNSENSENLESEDSGENKNKRLGEEKEDLENIFSETQKLYSQEFDLTLFDKSINMLRLGMETLTQAKLKAKIKYLEENGFEKEVDENGKIMGFIMKKVFKKQLKITYTKGDIKNGDYELVTIPNNIENFDKEERLLRDKIGIEKFKKKLEKARRENDQKEINKLELEASNKIIETLYNTYPYYLTKEDNGYQPNKIKEFEETYCLGFSLLGHAFLSELKINHNGLDIIDEFSPEGHSALEVLVGGKKYYSDPAYDKKILEYSYDYDEKDKVGAYCRNPLIKGDLLQPGDPKKILLSQILNSKGISLKHSGEYEEAIKIHNKAAELNPKDAAYYYNKSKVLYLSGKYNIGYVYEYIYVKLAGKTDYYGYSSVYDKIDKFIEKEDYEGLRKYLLELEESGEYE